MLVQWFTRRARRLGNLAQLGRVRKIDKLIEEAGDGEPRKVSALASCLSAGFEQFDPMDEILDSLDFRRIPQGPANLVPSEVNTNIHDAHEAVINIIHILRSLRGENARHKEVEEYSARCYRRLVSHWDDIAQWIFYLAAHASNPIEGRRPIVLLCCMALRCIIDDLPGDALREDLGSRSRTLDLVYFLLCQTELWEDRMRHITERDPSMVCPIAELLGSSFWHPPATTSPITRRLEAVRPETRDSIVVSILGRCQEVAELAKDPFLSQAARTMQYLVGSTFHLVSSRALWASFQHHNFLHIQAQAISLLCDKARQNNGDADSDFWDAIKGSVFPLVATTTYQLRTNPGAPIRTLVEGGILGSGLRCLQQSTTEPSSRGVYGALRSLLPYMTLHKVHQAVSGRGDMELWEGARETLPSSVMDLWTGYQIVFSINRYAYFDRGDVPVNMCSNRNHCLTVDPSPLSDDAAGLKVCSCHSVAYCSETCQKEDWVAFHSRECASLSWQYSERKRDGAWPSFRTKRDHVKYLEALANSGVPPPEELKSAYFTFDQLVLPTHPLEVNTFTCQPCSSIVRFDFVTKPYLCTTLQFPLKSHLYHNWGHPSFRCMQARIQQYVMDMEADQNVILAEGITQYDSKQRISTFVVLRYTAGAPEGRRYAIVNAVSRVYDGEPPTMGNNSGFGAEGNNDS